jgi:predicted CXXCH cytochrome family protein
MNNTVRWGSIFAVAGLLFAGSPVFAQVTIVGSQHDLTTGGTGQDQTAATDEVCVFCHTPHGADITAPVPLWNKVLNSNEARFTRYSTLATPSFDSTEADVGSVSLACLSCHDGTQAMDVVINAPGSGGYNAAGTEIDLGAVGQMVGVPAGAPIPALGEDLTNDHPISMQYAAGGCDENNSPGPCPGPLGDPDFKIPQMAEINGEPIWWVDGPAGGAGGVGVRTKTDMLLYSRPDLGTVQPFVECGSCHDPHNSDNASGTQVAFLRQSNAASAVCTACHSK